MPREVTETKILYKFDELSDEAKEKAREWYREGNLGYDWWDGVYDWAAEAADALGIDLRQKPVKLMNGKTRYDPCIWFQGFYMQRSGSAYDANYRYKKGSVKAIKKLYPKETELHSIAERLYREQRMHRYTITAKVKSRRDTSVSVEDIETEMRNADLDWKAIDSALTDFNSWIFSKLESEYEYLNSDEQVDESIKANDYEFTEDGECA